MPNTQSPSRPSKAEAGKPPKWVTVTPPDIHRDYALTMTGREDQDIDLTRDEFITLKAILAHIRGYRNTGEKIYA